MAAEVEVLENGRRVATLRPGQRFYPAAQSPFASVDVRYGLTRDLYVILGSFDREGRWATLKVQIHPMIAWIWLGGAVVVLGGLVALWPQRRPGFEPIAAPAPGYLARGVETPP